MFEVLLDGTDAIDALAAPPPLRLVIPSAEESHAPQ